MAATPDSQAKFEAVLALLVQLRPGLTRTQLLKLAYFVDFDSYQSEGHSVTGLSWLALPFGPVPHDFQRRLSAIVLTGLLTASPSNVGDHDATRYSLAPGAQIPAVLDLNQQAYVENVVADRGGASAARLVSDTHLDVPWRAVWKGLSGEPIPYDLASQRPDMDPWERAPSNIRKHLEQAAHHRLITTEMATAGINTARCLTRWTGLPVEAVVSDDGGVSIVHLTPSKARAIPSHVQAGLPENPQRIASGTKWDFATLHSPSRPTRCHFQTVATTSETGRAATAWRHLAPVWHSGAIRQAVGSKRRAWCILCALVASCSDRNVEVDDEDDRDVVDVSHGDAEGPDSSASLTFTAPACNVVRVVSDGGFRAVSETVFSEDANGRLVRETHDLGQDGHVDLVLDYLYDLPGVAVEIRGQLGFPFGGPLDRHPRVEVRAAEGRITEVRYQLDADAPERVESYFYNENRQLIEVREERPELGTTFEYDSAERLVRETRGVPTADHYRLLHYRYTETGELEEVVWEAQEGIFETWTLRCVAGLIQDFQFESLYPLVLDLAEIGRGTMRYDEGDRLVAIEGGAFSWTYDYDERGRPLTATRTAASGEVQEERIYRQGCRSPEAAAVQRGPLDRRFLPRFRSLVATFPDFLDVFSVEEQFTRCLPY